MKLFLSICISACALSACGGEASTAPGTQPSQQKPEPPAGAMVMSAKEHVFVPSKLALKVGEPVTLFITNDGADDHDLKSDLPIRALGYAHADNAADEQATNIEHDQLDVDFAVGHYAQVTFIPTTAGTFAFKCGHPGHADKGMVGQFVVAP